MSAISNALKAEFDAYDFLQNTFSHTATVIHPGGTLTEKLLLQAFTFSAIACPHPRLWHSNMKAFCKRGNFSPQLVMIQGGIFTCPN